MVWIIVCLGVFIAAFAMWDSIHEEIPEKLRLPRHTEMAAREGSVSASSAAVGVIGSNHWAVNADGKNLRASREFLNGIVANGAHYYPPVLHVSCYGGGLFAWISAGLQALGEPTKPDHVAVRVNGGPVEYWQKGEGAVLVAPAPAKLIDVLQHQPELTLELAFEEAPLQTLRLGTDGINDLMPRLALCGGSKGS